MAKLPRSFSLIRTYRTATELDSVRRRWRVRRSRRKRYTHYVIGQLMQIALALYDVTVDIIVVDERQEDDGCHVTFRLDFINKEAESRRSEEVDTSRCAVVERRLPPVTGLTFFQVS